MSETNFDPTLETDWLDFFGVKKRVTSDTRPALGAPVRRGIAGVVDNWNGMDREHKITTLATVAVLGVIGVEAAYVAKEFVGPGVDNVRRGLELAVFNATCGGGVDHVGSCGNTSAGNFLARTIGAGFDWLSMPKRFAEQARSGNGVPSLEVTAKTVALGLEEWKVGAVRKTAGKVLGTGIRLLPTIGSMRPPKPEEKE